jgi:hypothetical protein
VTVLDEIARRRLQDHFSDALVTIVGSGHSADLGIPNMRALADELTREMPSRVGAAATEWNAVAAELASGAGLEAALDRLKDDSELIPEVVAVTAAFIGAAEKPVLGEILGGTRRFALAELLRHVVFAGDSQIITTNYDRIVELAVELAGYSLDCSFLGAHACSFDPDASRESMRSEIVKRGSKAWLRYRRHVRLWKPHGSLDWYLRDGEPFRTPYPVGLSPLMITPGASKYLRGYDRPFDRHREEANHAIDAAARFLTIGYGFNDPHLQTHVALRIRSGAPTLMLMRTLTDAARELVANGSGVIALERRAGGGTLIHMHGDELEVPDANLWSLDGFIDEVLE